jgi:hypothetical protein
MMNPENPMIPNEYNYDEAAVIFNFSKPNGTKIFSISLVIDANNKYYWNIIYENVANSTFPDLDYINIHTVKSKFQSSSPSKLIVNTCNIIMLKNNNSFERKWEVKYSTMKE